ncbi:hypothetical protein C7413_112125 [Paraburkholderia silvatlantica]|nr:hypothetical protein C7413_112125 [Paraburkholderia silvatlantica]
MNGVVARIMCLQTAVTKRCMAAVVRTARGWEDA